jgi:hypothetical protein
MFIVDPPTDVPDEMKLSRSGSIGDRAGDAWEAPGGRVAQAGAALEQPPPTPAPGAPTRARPSAETRERRVTSHVSEKIFSFSPIV